MVLILWSQTDRCAQAVWAAGAKDTLCGKGASKTHAVMLEKLKIKI